MSPGPVVLAVAGAAATRLLASPAPASSAQRHALVRLISFPLLMTRLTTRATIRVSRPPQGSAHTDLPPRGRPGNQSALATR